MTIPASSNAQPPQSTASETVARETFQALLSALSNPGHIFTLPGVARATRQSCYQIGIALLDLETSFFTPDLSLAEALQRSGASALAASSAAYLFFPDEAAFIGSAAEETFLSIEQASVGTIVDPDEGATVIVGCGLGLGQTLRLYGPGIQQAIEVRIDRLPVEFWQLRTAKINYPLGIDLFLVDGGQVVGLPRTTMIELA